MGASLVLTGPLNMSIKNGNGNELYFKRKKLKSSDHRNNPESQDELLKAVLDLNHFHVEGPVKQWYVEDELIEQMRDYSGEDWLPIFEKHLPTLHNNDHMNTLFHLAGHLLKDLGADFVRKHWGKWSEETFRGLTFAAIHCLSLMDAYGLVTDKLGQMNQRERLICKFVLGWFENRLVLKWIEENVVSPIDVTWGALAARSEFDWKHFEKWLTLGRPISLVALDALGFCLTTPKAPDGHQYKALINPPTEVVLKNVLENYRKIDPAARARRTIEFLMSKSSV